MTQFEIKNGIAIIPKGTTEIEKGAFKDCTSLEGITIPEGVVEIGYGAFFRCTSLKSIKIPESVTEIGEYAFSECASLESITIPGSVKVLGYGAFFCCRSLKSIIIPESVTKIGEAAFVGCSSLESIVVAEGNPVYDSREGCNAIIETKTNILCYGCKSTNIPQSVAKIGGHAFCGCTSLEGVTIPMTVTEIGDFAFCDCRLLESITIPESVTKIGNSAFKGCRSLKSITIPESVTEIDSLAFLGCTSLKCVTFLSRTKLSDEVFSYSSQRTINVPSDCVDYYKEALPEKFHDRIVKFEPEKKTKLLLNDDWKEDLAAVYEHIKHNCAPDDYDNGYNRKGIIVADDETGELLTMVKEALKYDELDAAEKVNEITVDEHWPLNSLDRCWNMLLTEARRINHGLLVINVNDIRIFKHSWCIKQLAKQEAHDLKFNEYVLLVIKDISWTKVKEYANKYNKGQFDAMMQFYSRIRQV